MAPELHRGWRPARVVENRAVARGSMWLALEALDDLPADYDPGHVLVLGLKDNGDRFLRHAYTVSRGETSRRRFEHLYRVIPEGRMTPRLAELSPGAAVFFHGPFHTPIQEEIDPSAESITLIATGTGIGPLFGYVEKTLAEGEVRPLALYAGFHQEADFCLIDALDGLKRTHPNFVWRFMVTHPSDTWRGLKGRVTECVPSLLPTGSLRRQHFHLVGNGEMVNLVHEALYRAGALAERVSIETYFNHHAKPSDEEIERLAERFRLVG